MSATPEEKLVLAASASTLFTGPYVGAFLDTILQGMIIPIFISYVSISKSHKPERLLLSIAFLVGLYDSILIILLVIELGVFDFNNPTTAVLMLHWQVVYGPISSGIVWVIVQGVYAFRLYRLQTSNVARRVVIAVLGSLISAFAISNIGLIVVRARAPDDLYDPITLKITSSYQTKILTWTLIYYSLLLATNAMISTCTSFHLLHMISDKGEVDERPNPSPISRIWNLSIQTMLIPTILTLLVLVSRLASPRRDGRWDMIFLLPLPKVALYSCLLMLTPLESWKTSLATNSTTMSTGELTSHISASNAKSGGGVIIPEVWRSKSRANRSRSLAGDGGELEVESLNVNRKYADPSADNGFGLMGTRHGGAPLWKKEDNKPGSYGIEGVDGYGK